MCTPSPQSEPSGMLVPPARRPPTATGADTPPHEPSKRSARGFGAGLLGQLRRLEVAIFGPRRTIGPRRGPTPTF